MLFSLLLMASDMPPKAVSSAPSWGVIAEGPIEHLAAAKAEMVRCRFSRIEVVATRGGHGQLRVPSAEMLPRRAACLNNVADTLTLPGLKWSGPDLRKY